jgi:hypothetical protein
MCSPGTEIFYQGALYDGHCLNSSHKLMIPTSG